MLSSDSTRSYSAIRIEDRATEIDLDPGELPVGLANQKGRSH